ncbi:uncharacterized protein LOC114909171 [Scleropages formosus]|uniref:uncharacterized protein LOC114909171 n=1 Tax=Scleropages formosus TaxID=113540 RepID=UPI0010FA92D0|nr:uncharacterized protein LOC114909171 [Scleropages formosus]
MTTKEEKAESSVPLPKDIFSQGSSHFVDISSSSHAPPSSFPLQSSCEETSTELTAKNILDIIMKRIFQDAEQVKDLDLIDTNSARERRLDMLRSTETIQLLSPELVQEVHCFIMVDSNALSVLKRASYRINTELALLKTEGGGRLELARQAFSELVHVFIGKCVRHLLLEFFCFLTQHYDKSEGLIAATAASPSGPLQDVSRSVAKSETSDVCGGKSAQIVLKPPSEASSNTMELLVTLMVNEVMKFLSVKVGGFNQGEIIDL